MRDLMVLVTDGDRTRSMMQREARGIAGHGRHLPLPLLPPDQAVELDRVSPRRSCLTSRTGVAISACAASTRTSCRALFVAAQTHLWEHGSLATIRRTSRRALVPDGSRNTSKHRNSNRKHMSNKDENRTTYPPLPSTRSTSAANLNDLIGHLLSAASIATALGGLLLVGAFVAVVIALGSALTVQSSTRELFVSLPLLTVVALLGSLALMAGRWARAWAAIVGQPPTPAVPPPLEAKAVS